MGKKKKEKYLAASTTNTIESIKTPSTESPKRSTDAPDDMPDADSADISSKAVVSRGIKLRKTKKEKVTLAAENFSEVQARLGSQVALRHFTVSEYPL